MENIQRLIGVVTEEFDKGFEGDDVDAVVRDKVGRLVSNFVADLAGLDWRADRYMV